MKQLELRKRKRDYHNLNLAAARRASARLELVAYAALQVFAETPPEAFWREEPRGIRAAVLRARARRLLRVRGSIEGWISYLERKLADEMEEMQRHGR